MTAAMESALVLPELPPAAVPAFLVLLLLAAFLSESVAAAVVLPVMPVLAPLSVVCFFDCALPCTHRWL